MQGERSDALGEAPWQVITPFQRYMSLPKLTQEFSGIEVLPLTPGGLLRRDIHRGLPGLLEKAPDSRSFSWQHQCQTRNQDNERGVACRI